MRRSGAIAAAKRRNSALYARPNSTFYSSGATAVGAGTIHGAINEEVADDATYVEFSGGSRECRIGLSAIAAPAAGAPHAIYLRTGNVNATYVIQLQRANQQVIASWSPTGTVAFSQHVLALSSSEVAAITDYGSLALYFYAYQNGARISQAAFVVGTP